MSDAPERIWYWHDDIVGWLGAATKEGAWPGSVEYVPADTMRTALGNLERLLSYPVSTDIDSDGFAVRHDEATVRQAVKDIREALK